MSGDKSNIRKRSLLMNSDLFGGEPSEPTGPPAVPERGETTVAPQSPTAAGTAVTSGASVGSMDMDMPMDPLVTPMDMDIEDGTVPRRYIRREPAPVGCELPFTGKVPAPEVHGKVPEHVATTKRESHARNPRRVNAGSVRHKFIDRDSLSAGSKRDTVKEPRVRGLEMDAGRPVRDVRITVSAKRVSEKEHKTRGKVRADTMRSGAISAKRVAEKKPETRSDRCMAEAMRTDTKSAKTDSRTPDLMDMEYVRPRGPEPFPKKAIVASVARPERDRRDSGWGRMEIESIGCEKRPKGMQINEDSPGFGSMRMGDVNDGKPGGADCRSFKGHL